MIPAKSSAIALAVGLAATGLTATTELAGAFVYTCSTGDGVGRRPRGAFVRRRESQTSSLIRSGGNRCYNDDDDQGRARGSIRCRATTKMGMLRRGRRGTEVVSLLPMADDSDSDKGDHSVVEVDEVDGRGERKREVHDALTEVEQGVAQVQDALTEAEQGVALATEVAVEAVMSAAEEAESTRQTYTAAALRGLKRARVALEEALDELGRSTGDELGLAPPAYMDLPFPFPLTSDSSDDNEALAGDGVEGEGRGRDKRDKERVGWLRQWQKKGAVPTAEVMGEVLEENLEALDDRVERARASVETALNELGLAVPSELRDREGISGDDDETEFEGGVPASEIKSAAAAATVAAAEAAAEGGGQRWWLPERLRARLEELDAATDTAAGLGPQASAEAAAASGSSQRDIGKFFRRSPLSSIQSQGNVAKRAVKRAKNALGTAIDDLGLTRPTVGSALERFLNADEVVGLWRQEEELEDQLPHGDDILPGTDIGPPERRIWVVTTAALPWMTGTSVNPLLRAAYLSRGREPGKVSLMVPWLSPEDQEFVLPKGKRFDTQEEQGAFVRDWLRKAGMKAEADDLRIFWYDARYHQLAGSIFPMGDLTRLIPDDEADVCILEEPEHLNWFRATGVNWSKKFTHVVGVIHTNYVHYTTADTSHWASGKVKAPFARAFNKIMARAYCDKVIKLSATLQRFAQEKETVANVHGVRENFLIVGDERKEAAASGEPFPEERPYFLGKMLWEKGYDRLWDLLKGFQDAEALADEGEMSPAEGIDSGGVGEVVLCAYGSGPDSEAIHEKAQDMGLAVKFHPATDHAELTQYKTFVNPSESEVLCTTVAEALAMGKFAIIAEHPSNEFFYQFPNALRFKNQEEFNRQLKFSMENQPTPLTPEKRHVLGWEAATDRLVESAKVTVKEARRRRRELDEAAWLFHYYLGSGRRGDRLRKILAGGVAAEQNAHMDMVLKAEEEEAQNEDEESANPASSTSAKSAAGKVSSEG